MTDVVYVLLTASIYALPLIGSPRPRVIAFGWGSAVVAALALVFVYADVLRLTGGKALCLVVAGGLAARVGVAVTRRTSSAYQRTAVFWRVLSANNNAAARILRMTGAEPVVERFRAVAADAGNIAADLQARADASE